MSLPPVSIIVPTFNSGKTLNDCLINISSQKYPKEKIELIIVDGGSCDNTKQIAAKYTNIILDNPDKVEEKGRVLGIEKAKGDIVAFIDADNLLTDENSLQKIIQPFIDDDRVIFSEPKFYSSRKDDDNITKYISLIGADDPVAVYLGIYDRYCYFKSDWTDSPYEILTKKNDYDIIKLENINSMPPLGANGCFIKKSALLNIKYGPFLHTDVIYNLLSKNNFFAKVNTGLVHKQDGSLSNFLRKKSRRFGRNYKELERSYYFRVNKKAAIILFLKCFFIFPLFVDAVIGYKNKKDKVWLLHPFITLLTIIVYGIRKIF